MIWTLHHVWCAVGPSLLAWGGFYLGWYGSRAWHRWRERRRNR